MILRKCDLFKKVLAIFIIVTLILGYMPMVAPNDYIAEASNYNKTFLFDGIDDYASAPTNGYSTNKTYTVEMWIKATEYKDGVHLWEGESGSRPSIEGKSDELKFITGNTNYLSTGKLSLDNWHHIAASYDKSEQVQTLYVDGIRVGRLTGVDVDDTFGNQIFFGNRDGWNRNFPMMIDEVRIWDTARSDAEIRKNMYKELVGDETGLVAYYDFNEGTGTQLTDKTVNHNDATISGNSSGWADSEAMCPIMTSITDVNTTGLTANWIEGESGREYSIEIDDNPSFSSSTIITPDADKNTEDCIYSYEISGQSFLENTEYYVRICSEKNGQTSAYSATHKFMIEPGMAIEFDGVDDYISVADDNTLDLENAMTIEFWIEPLEDGGQTVLCKSVSDVDENFRIYIDPSHDDIYWDYGGTTQYVRTNTASFDVNEWHHMAMCVKAGEPGKIYLDGEEVTYKEKKPADASLSTNNEDIIIGKVFSDTDFGNFKMDELKIWNTVRTQGAIQNGMYQELTGDEDGLVLYYNFNETNGTTVEDKARKGNDGTFNNMTNEDWIQSDAMRPVIKNIGPVTSSTVDVTWRKVEIATGYEIEIAKDNNFSDIIKTEVINNGNTTSTTITELSLKKNTNYYIRMSFKKDKGTSPYSEVKTLVDSNMALDFDGIDDYVEFGNVINNLNHFTIEYWMNINTFTQGDYMGIFGQNEEGSIGSAPSGSVNNFAFTTGNNGSAFGLQGCFTDGTWFDLRQPIPFGVNTWQHVATVYDGNTIKTYVNGIETNSQAHVGKTFGNNEKMLMAKGVAFPNSQRLETYYDGQMDEFRIWSIAKTSDEIKANMYQELQGNEANLFAYYNFNADSGTILTDISCNGHDGDLKNMEDGDWVKSGALCPIITQTTEITDKSFKANWLAIPNATAYYMDIDDNADFGSLIADNIHIGSGTSYTYISSNLSGGQSYYYRIRAELPNGTTPNSATQSFNTLVQKALELNNHPITIPDSPSLDISGNALTLETWVNIDNIDEHRFFISKEWDLAYGLSYETSNKIWFYSKTNNNHYIKADVAPDDLLGSWHHIAGVYDGSTQKIYLDGKKVAEQSASGNLLTNDSPLFIGKGNASYYPMVGSMDEVRIWNIPRTEQEIKDNMYHELNGNESGLVAYYNFNGSSTTQLTDQTGNANHGTFTGAPRISSNCFDKPPTDINLSCDNIKENEDSGTLIGTLSATDDDIGETFTYALTSGTGDTDNADFTILGDKLYSNAEFDYETKNAYNIKIGATNSKNKTYKEAFIINITNEKDVASLESGYYNTMLSFDTGENNAWGNNADGMFGYVPDSALSKEPLTIPGHTGFKHLSSYWGKYVLGTKEDGTVWSWGQNYCGRLGSGEVNKTTDNPKPKKISSLSNIKETATGSENAYALTYDGDVYAWGYEHRGAVGNGVKNSDPNVVYEPVKLATLDTLNIKNIEAGYLQGFALADTGEVYSWGQQVYGLLGTGAGDNSYNETPTKISALLNIEKLDVYYTDAVALDSNGDVYVWGYQFGQGLPQKVIFPESITIVDVVIGNGYILALDDSGKVYSMGSGTYGALGLGSTTNQSTPVEISSISKVTGIYSGAKHSFIITEDKKVYGFGKNEKGQLGDGTFADQHTPIQITAIDGDTTQSILTSGENSFIIKNDGSVDVIGYNGTGMFADGLQPYSRVPGRATNIPKFSKISLGNNYGIGLKADGTVWTWGINNNGQLGDGTTIDHYTPEQVTSLSDIVDISTENGATLALAGDGKIYAWGSNSNYRLGTGDSIGKNSPVLVNLTNVDTTSGDKIVQVSMGQGHALARSRDGKVYAWGKDRYGCLGIPSISHTVNVEEYATIPILVPDNGFGMATNINAGVACSFIVGDNGGLWSTGYQSGDENYTMHAVPFEVKLTDGLAGDDYNSALALNNVTQIGNGYYNTAVLTSDGKVYTFGANDNGSAGNGLETPQRAPYEVMSDVKHIASGKDFTIAVKKDGTVWAWGKNNLGQLGDGTATNRLTPVKISLNRPPTDIGLDHTAVDERSQAGTLIGNLDTTDPDIGDAFTYIFASGSGDDDNSKFTIDRYMLKVKDELKYSKKASYNIRIKSTDGGDESVEKTFVIDLNDIAPLQPTIMSVDGSTNDTVNTDKASVDIVVSNVEAGDTIKLYNGAVELESEVATSTTCTITLSGLASGTTYTLRAKAVDTDEHNKESALSEIVTLKTADDPVVSIPNVALRAEIEKALGITPGTPITESKMATLTSLDLSGKGITDLIGLEYATNLTNLDISNNEITNISPLSNLIKLTTLDMSGNKVENISSLSTLTELKDLDLSGNKVTDITAIGSLTKLTSLDMADNSIENISALNNLNSLNQVNMSGNNIDPSDTTTQNIINKLETQGATVTTEKAVTIPDSKLRAALEEALGLAPGEAITEEKMATLTSLDLSGKGITSLTGLEHATNLTSLDISNNEITDISPLSTLTKLTTLDMSDNSIENISALNNLNSLTQVNMSGNNIDTSDTTTQNIINKLETQGATVTTEKAVTIPDSKLRTALEEALGLAPGDTITEEKMATLTSLDLSGKSITDLTGLQHATNLTSLDISNNEITDISSLSTLTKLTTLDMSGNKVEDISSLSTLTELTDLDISGNKVTDITAIGSLTKLTTLDISNNKVEDISALSTLIKLESLNISNNEIEDITPLESLNQLKSLNIAENRIEDIKPIQQLTALEVLNMENNKITDITPISNLDKLKSISMGGNRMNEQDPQTAQVINTLKAKGATISTEVVDQYLSGLTTDTGTLTPVFEKETNQYNIRTSKGDTSIQITPVLQSDKASMSVEYKGVDKAHSSGTPYLVENLVKGNNIVKIKIKNSNQVLLNAYTIAVYVPSKKKSSKNNNTNNPVSQKDEKVDSDGDGIKDQSVTEITLNPQGIKALKKEGNDDIEDQGSNEQKELEYVIEVDGQSDKVELEMDENVVDAIKKDAQEKDALLTLAGKNGKMQLPVEELDNDALAEKTGLPKSETEGAQVIASIEKLGKKKEKEVMEKVQADRKNSGEKNNIEFVVPVMNFGVEVESEQGKPQPVKEFEKYSQRTMTFEKEEMKRKPDEMSIPMTQKELDSLTVVKVDEKTGKMTVVPAQITLNDKGEIQVDVYHNGLGNYTVIKNDIEIKVNDNHWAAETAKHMMKKYMMDDIFGTELDLNRKATRQEVASAFVSLLGIDSSKYKAKKEFKDLDETNPLYHQLVVANGLEIILGYGDGTLKPKQLVTRQGGAAIAHRAINVAKVLGLKEDIEYVDKEMINDWAKGCIGGLTEEKIFVGRENNQFDPYANITIGEVMTLMKRLEEYMLP